MAFLRLLWSLGLLPKGELPEESPVFSRPGRQREGRTMSLCVAGPTEKSVFWLCVSIFSVFFLKNKIMQNIGGCLTIRTLTIGRYFCFNRL